MKRLYRVCVCNHPAVVRTATKNSNWRISLTLSTVCNVTTYLPVLPSCSGTLCPESRKVLNKLAVPLLPFFFVASRTTAHRVCVSHGASSSSFPFALTLRGFGWQIFVVGLRGPKGLPRTCYGRPHARRHCSDMRTIVPMSPRSLCNSLSILSIALRAGELLAEGKE